MEKFNEDQIEQFLQIKKIVVCSADHLEISNDSYFFGDTETVSGLTITTSLTTISPIN